MEIKIDEITTLALGKREERRLERRRKILAVAAKSFLENGYAGTTMSGISVLLGGSKGTLWHHFSSKEELFAAFLDDATSAFKRELITTFELSTDLESALETFARRFIEKISTPETVKMYRLMVGEGGRYPEIGNIFYDRVPGAVETILARFLEAHMKAGRLRTDDPARAARLLMTFCVGRGHQQILFGGPEMDPAIIPGEALQIVRYFLLLYVPPLDDPAHSP